MKKKGQIDSHIFVYILAVLILGAIFFIGYRLIAHSSSAINKGEVIQLKNKLAADINSVGKEFGKFKKVAYVLPAKLNEVCFVDLTKKNDVVSSKLIDFYPIIKDDIKSNSGNNLFFFGSADKVSYAIGDFEINHYPYLSCFKSQEDKINLGLSGLGGGKTQVITDFITKAKLNSKKSIVLQSADGVLTFEIAPGTTANNNEISIEMVEPPKGSKAASDIYKLEPSGTQFSQPIKMMIKFNPSLVGGCPASLVFNQVNKDTGNSYVVTSTSIDCDRDVAAFEIAKFI